MSERRVLAESAVTRVEVCDCGTCYLTVGPVTLTLHPSALGELARTVTRAMRALRATNHPVQPEGPALHEEGPAVEEPPTETEELELPQSPIPRSN